MAIGHGFLSRELSECAPSFMAVHDIWQITSLSICYYILRDYGYFNRFSLAKCLKIRSELGFYAKFVINFRLYSILSWWRMFYFVFSCLTMVIVEVLNRLKYTWLSSTRCPVPAHADGSVKTFSLWPLTKALFDAKIAHLKLTWWSWPRDAGFVSFPDMLRYLSIFVFL